MAANSNVAPVIIKRKKIVVAGGHHGGAWKVAYADFVTAMMAFFMLMWLLNATTEKQRKGLADYFSPTISVSRVSGGGDGALGGDSVFAEHTKVRSGTGGTWARSTQEGVAPDTDRQDLSAEDLSAIENMLTGRSGESMASDEMLRHIVTRVTDEGLVIEMFDLDGVPLFDDAGAPTAMLRALAGLVSEAAGLVVNAIAVEAHVRARPVVLRDNPVWQGSWSRADAVRELLQAEGTAPARMRRVTGHADRAPATPDPMDLRNNRIEVIFLRKGLT